MTNYAAFYVGRGENAEWIGTVRGDGVPGGLAAAEAGHQPLDATSETAYRAAVAAFLRVWEQWVDHAYVPDESDPNDYSELADLAYAFDDGQVWTRRTLTDPWEPAHGASTSSPVSDRTTADTDATLPSVQRGDPVPGGVTVVAVESVGPGSVDGCWDCGRAFTRGEVVVRVCEVAAPEERYVLHRHCVGLRYLDRPRYVPVREHAQTFARVGRAVDALAELSVPGGEFETLIDELADSFGVLRALVEV